jgi:hypothetical protein
MLKNVIATPYRRVTYDLPLAFANHMPSRFDSLASKLVHERPSGPRQFEGWQQITPWIMHLSELSNGPRNALRRVAGHPKS